MTKLALFGGTKVRSKPFPPHPVISDDEKKAVLEVLDSGNLSTFVAEAGENFYHYDGTILEIGSDGLIDTSTDGTPVTPVAISAASGSVNDTPKAFHCY